MRAQRIGNGRQDIVVVAAPGFLDHDVARPVDEIDIATIATDHPIVTGIAIKLIVTVITDQRIVARSAAQFVIVLPTRQAVIAVRPLENRHTILALLRSRRWAGP
jgi:hypothetical protein